MDEDRRNAIDRRKLESRMLILEEQHIAIQTSMDANTKAIQEFIDISHGLKFGLKIANVIEAIAVWFAKIVAAGAIVWATWKFLVREAIAHIK